MKITWKGLGDIIFTPQASPTLGSENNVTQALPYYFHSPTPRGVTLQGVKITPAIHYRNDDTRVRWNTTTVIKQVKLRFYKRLPHQEVNQGSGFDVIKATNILKDQNSF